MVLSGLAIHVVVSVVFFSRQIMQGFAEVQSVLLTDDCVALCYSLLLFN